MAEQEEDFSLLPLQDRFTHKNWKVRKEGYEDAAKQFSATPDESAPLFRPFVLDSGIWKGAVTDSNVAAQQEGVNALCSFLKYGGAQACSRSRSATITPIVEKGLSSTKAATKQGSLEALLLYVEVEGKSDALLEDLLQGLSNKQPKIVAATLGAITALHHAFGVKIVEPKQSLKALPKVFGHADKNVRAEASNLAVELYRWLREAMKPLFWNELKPVQQQELEKSFEAVKTEPTPKQDRLLRSQQEAIAAAPVAGDEDADVGDDADEEEPEAEAVDLADPIEVLSKVPGDFQEQMASSKWKDRKDSLDALYEALNVYRIKDGHFDEIIQVLAKSMKDANIAVVTVAANCVDVLAKGLRQGFAKYRGRIMGPIMERLKEKKQSVADALGQALDSVFASTGLSESLEDILEFLKHKNPQVKSETLKFLIRCLRTTREAPAQPEVKSISDAATKLLTESVEVTRAGGAEVLGTLMKIMGERPMAPYMDGLDDIRKTKIKEYCDVAEVKARYKPKPVAPPPKAAAPAPKRIVKKTAPGLGPKAPIKRASTPQSEKPALSPQAKPAAKGISSKLGSLPKPGLAAPSGLKKKIPGAGPAPSLQSPRRNITSSPPLDEAPAPKLGRGLAGRPLGKPVSAPSGPTPSAPVGTTAAEREELEELKSDKDRLLRSTDELRSEKAKLQSQIHELQNQNAQLIEDHTRDVLSIKAKETQLVRARSDAEAAETLVQRQGREMERLKRELSRSVREQSPTTDDHIYQDRNQNGLPHRPGIESFDSSRSESREVGYQRARGYMGSPSEEKENGSLDSNFGKKPTMSRELSGDTLAARRGEDSGGAGGGPGGNGTGQGVDSYKRAAEVTSQLKARIEQMKVQFRSQYHLTWF